MAQVMYFDETPVVTLSALLQFCDRANKYYKFGTNHWALFKEIRKNDSDMTAVGSRLAMSFPKNQPPKELIEAMQKFFADRKVSDDKLRQILVNSIPHHNYKAKYSMVNGEQLRREFERFKLGVVKAVNRRRTENGGISMLLTRPVKKGATKG